MVLVFFCLLAVGFAFSRSGSSSGSLYVCPMHPEVRSERSGDCPVCGMALEPWRRAAPLGAEAAAADPTDSAPARGDVKPALRQVFSQAIEAPAWLDAAGRVQAILYNDELPSLSNADLPFAYFGARTDPPRALSRAPEPPLPWDESTSRVGFRFEGAVPDGLAPQSVGRVLLTARRTRSSLVVPEQALLSLGHGPYVLVRAGESDRFEQRPLRIGKIQYQKVTVVSGLSEHEPVLVRNAFFLDAERRLGVAPAGMP